MPYNVLSASNSAADLDAVGILATGSWVPDRVVTNEELAAQLGVTAAWIEDRTGVVERRVADAVDATSDLATRAAERALAAAGIGPDELDMIVVATSTPDRPLPATACQVQANLGATRAYAFDLDAVCTGFVYALDVARKAMQCDPGIRHALVIGADTYSRILDYRDRRTCVLFGDGAGAVVLGRGPEVTQVWYSSLGSDGTKNDYVTIPAGGSRSPIDGAALAADEHLFRMRGNLVRQFVLTRMPAMIAEVTAATGLGVGDIDLLVPHQANVRLLEEVAKNVGFAADQVAITGDRYGNTGAASVAVTLDYAVRSGQVRPGSRLLLAAIGGGMTWGSMLLTWPGQPSPGDSGVTG